MTADTTIAPWTTVVLDVLTIATQPAGSTSGALGLGPPPVARILALIYTAGYQAWAAYTKNAHQPEPGGPAFTPTIDNAVKARATSYAIYTACKHVFRSDQSPIVQQKLDAELVRQQPNTAIDAGAQTGIDAANAVIASRDADGSNWQNLYAPPAGNFVPKNPPVAVFNPTFRRDIPFPSSWQELTYLDKVTGLPKTPHFITPHWKDVKSFALQNGAQFRPAKGPATVAEERYVDQARHVLTVQQNLTFRQKVIAEYWADGPKSWLPPGHWCDQARMFVEQAGYTLDQNAMLFFTMTNAVFDVSITTWEAKLFYNSVRPITAIRWLFNGHKIEAWVPTGGNALIDGEIWRPFQKDTFPTPPFPEFTSGHSAFSMAAATVLRAFAKSDTFNGSYTRPAVPLAAEPDVPVTDSITLNWVTFTEAALEAGESRIFGGIHFHEGNIVGLEMGRLVGENTWRKANTLFPPNSGHTANDAADFPHYT